MGFEKNGFTELEKDYKDLEIFIKDSVGLISLKKFKEDIKAHRQSGNHLDYRLMMELKDSLSSFEVDPGINSIILTSSHKVAFSRGAKIEEILGASTQKCRTFLYEAQEMLLCLQSIKKPIIAAINGLTLGGGFELALACDYRVASTRENVVFGFPETSLGLIPAMGGTQNLRRIIGEIQARKIIANSIVNINTETARTLNIVDKTASPSELINEAYQLAMKKDISKRFNPHSSKLNVSSNDILEEIHNSLEKKPAEVNPEMTSAPLARALTDLIFDNTHFDQYLNGLLYEFEVFCFLQQTEDCREGIQAMIDERKAVFKGR